MSYSNSFEGGLNTITRVFPAGTTGTNRIVGVMPKDGKITRIRYHGDVLETGPLTINAFIYDPTGAASTAITAATDIDAAFTSATNARRGVEAVLMSQAARDARALQVIVVNITGSTIGDIAVVVQFDPR